MALSYVSFQRVGFEAVDTLVTPSSYEIGYYIPGSMGRGAIGRPWIQAHVHDALREFTLTWEAMDNTSAQELEDAFYSLCSAPTIFTDHHGDEYQVIRHPGQDRIVFKMVRAGVQDTRWLWSTRLQMVENPF